MSKKRSRVALVALVVALVMSGLTFVGAGAASAGTVRCEAANFGFTTKCSERVRVPNPYYSSWRCSSVREARGHYDLLVAGTAFPSTGLGMLKDAALPGRLLTAKNFLSAFWLPYTLLGGTSYSITEGRYCNRTKTETKTCYVGGIGNRCDPTP